MSLSSGTTDEVGRTHKTMVFKIPDIRQQRTVILERWETNEVSLTTTLAY